MAREDHNMPARTLSKKSPIRYRPNARATALTPALIRSFQKKIYNYYDDKGRDLPWRKRVTPYRVFVSEIMLQQTQVDRVIDKFKEFLAVFPDFPALAKAPLPKLLKLWSGMGYNRRALALKALAQKVMSDHKGRLPFDPSVLITLPGIGPYTAGAIAAFAFNKPVVFMDTNIRRVFIHEFLHDRKNIRDDELVPLVRQTLDTKNPRKWYNALMDYGSMLKKEQVNPNKRSAHYARQSPFENSNRQARGMILKVLVRGTPLMAARIVKETGRDVESVKKNLEQLAREGFIVKKRDRYYIK
jgi:A/G-specific adenine glycosylase